MTSRPVIPLRYRASDPRLLRSLELVAMSPNPASGVVDELARVAAPGWATARLDASGGSWIQRRVAMWGEIVSSLASGGFWMQSLDRERPGAGWLIIRVGPIGDAGSRLDLTGELDEPMEQVVSSLLRSIDAEVRMRRAAMPPARLRPGRSAIPSRMRRKLPIRRAPLP